MKGEERSAATNNKKNEHEHENEQLTIVGRPSPCELVIKKSKFITNMARVSSVQEAKAFVGEIKQIHSTATHNCSAFLIQDGVMGYSDDGEPHQTAGAPMLNVLDKWMMREVAVVVTRYFGGTKLGTGGLIRAYSGAVVEALSVTDLVEFVEMIGVMATMPYNVVNGFQYLLAQNSSNVRVMSKTFEEEAVFIVEVKYPSVSKFITDAYAIGVKSVDVYE